MHSIAVILSADSDAIENNHKNWCGHMLLAG
jgi:hypothetical protein